MALYRIERHVGAVTPEEIDAAAFRAVACLPNFANLRWVRSYFDAQAQQFTCYYEADSAEDIRRHAQLAQIPCDHVAEVTEYLPSQYQ